MSNHIFCFQYVICRIIIESKSNCVLKLTRELSAHHDKQIHVGLDNHLVVNEMMKVGEKIDDLTKVIKSQPVYDGTEIRDVHSKMYELVRTIKKGNKKYTDINRFNA